MIKKKYIWIILIVSLILLTGYYADIRPQYGKFSELKVQENRVLLQLDADRQNMNKRVALAASQAGVSLTIQKQQNTQFFDLIQLAQLNSLRYQVASEQRADGVHLVMLGEWHQLLAFVSALTQQKAAIYIRNFSLKPLSAGGIRMELDIIFPDQFNRHLVPIVNPVIAMRTPFCHPHSRHVAEKMNDVTARQHFPVKEMKMTGYLRLRDQPHAFLMLPTNVTVDVVIGDVIGVEHVIVTDILPTHIKYGII